MTVETQALSNDQVIWLYLAYLDVLNIFTETSVGTVIYRTEFGPKLQDKAKWHVSEKLRGKKYEYLKRGWKNE